MSDQPASREQDMTYRPIDRGLRQDYERYDERWSKANQTRDWIILIAIGLIHFLWMFLIFLFEPGIR